TMAAARISPVRLDRSGTISSWPAFLRFSAIGRPMIPRPMNPIFMSLAPYGGSAFSPSWRTGRRPAMTRGMATTVVGEASNPERLPPAQAGDGVTRRAVFAADPALVTKGVDPAEHKRPTDFAGSRLIAGWNIRDLHMRDHRHELFHAS